MLSTYFKRFLSSVVKTFSLISHLHSYYNRYQWLLIRCSWIALLFKIEDAATYVKRVPDIFVSTRLDGIKCILHFTLVIGRGWTLISNGFQHCLRPDEQGACEKVCLYFSFFIGSNFQVDDALCIVPSILGLEPSKPSDCFSIYQVGL